jgi:hypothetical protein
VVGGEPLDGEALAGALALGELLGEHLDGIAVAATVRHGGAFQGVSRKPGMAERMSLRRRRARM